MKTYRVVAERSGKWWAAHVPELPGVHTQARRLEQVEAEARDAIALMLDVKVEAVKVSVEPVLPREVQEMVTVLSAAHLVAEKARLNEREAARDAARALVFDLGLPQRDAGRILGVTHQRVQQILAGSRSRKMPRLLAGHPHTP